MIDLAYADPPIGYGLAASAAALVVLFGVAGLLEVRRRRGFPPAASSDARGTSLEE